MNGVSVIICCYNSASKLPETLLHLANQITSDALPFEIIVVDNGSVDDTASESFLFWKNLNSAIPFRIIEEPLQGKNYAIEKGISESTFDIILFCDDDNLLHSGYIQLGFDYFLNNPNIGLLGGNGIPRMPSADIPEWFERYAYQYALGPQSSSSSDITIESGFVYGAGSFLKKSAFQDLKKRGFEYTLSGRRNGQIVAGEDNELGYALTLIGYSVHYYDALRFIHVLPASRLTWSYAKELKKRVAYSSILLIPYLEYRNFILLHKPHRFSWNKYLLINSYYLLTDIIRYPFSSPSFKADISLDIQSRLGRLQALFAHRTYLKNRRGWLPWLDKKILF